jgi:hypothetical protein
MPLRWLAGNTHLIWQCDYDWSTFSMGKAIDALHEAMMKLEEDGSLFLDEEFIKGKFDSILTDDDGNHVPLPPLVEAMEYQYKRKHTNAIGSLKVLPYAQLNAELFYPMNEANKATTKTVEVMAVEIAECMLGELHDPKKTTSDKLTCADGKVSWGNTFDEENYACLGKMATNDLVNVHLLPSPINPHYLAVYLVFTL